MSSTSIYVTEKAEVTEGEGRVVAEDARAGVEQYLWEG